MFRKLGYALFPKFTQDYGLFSPPNRASPVPNGTAVVIVLSIFPSIAPPSPRELARRLPYRISGDIIVIKFRVG